jgi:hypothetical protein
MRHETKAKGFEAQHIRTGEVRAFGTLEGSSVYEQLQNDAAAVVWRPEKYAPKAWFVERRLGSGQWVTASRGMQGRTLEEAKLIASAMPGYRVVTRDCFGRYR